jgi:hypothetical protein
MELADVDGDPSPGAFGELFEKGFRNGCCSFDIDVLSGM